MDGTQLQGVFLFVGFVAFNVSRAMNHPYVDGLYMFIPPIYGNLI